MDRLRRYVQINNNYDKKTKQHQSNFKKFRPISRSRPLRFSQYHPRRSGESDDVFWRQSAEIAAQKVDRTDGFR